LTLCPSRNRLSNERNAYPLLFPEAPPAVNVLLINPSQRTAYGKLADVPTFFPIGLGYLGAALEKNGQNATLIDVDAQQMTDEELKQRIERGAFGLIGITVTSPTVSSAFRLARLVKDRVKTPLVFGGVHATLFPSHPFTSEDVDFVVRGEGEETIVELADALVNNGDLAGIRGLSYRGPEGVVHNPARDPIKDLDSLPFPIMHKLNDNLYSYPNSLMKKIAPILASRGCPGRCTFCCTHKTFGTRVRYRSAANVAEEMKYLRDTFGIQEIHVWDDNFISRKAFVFELRDLMKKENLSFKICLINGVRVDFFNEEVAACLKDMGVYSLAFGLESGNQKVLDLAKKGINLEKSLKAMSIAKKAGFETWGFFMLGLPGEDKDTIQDTIDFAIKLDPDIAKFHVLKPFPGTEVYDYLKEKGFLLSTDFDRYGIHSKPVHRLETLSDDDLLEFQKKAYKAFYFRPKKILAQVRRLTSLKKIKFLAKAAFNLRKILGGDV
jgi:anaerobic magnesium-protoporphyrin IX monomethyl ester cyclase